MNVGHRGAGGTGLRQRFILGAFFAVATALSLYPREAAGVEAASDSTEVAKKQHELTVEAQGLQKKGDFRAALEKVNEGAALSPAGLEPRITRAGILMALERYQDALEEWSVVVAKMEPGSPQTYRLFQYRGLCRLKLGDLPGARADALEAKQLAPKTSDPKELEAIDALVDASTMAQASASPTPDPADSPASSNNDKSPFATKKQEDLAHEAMILQEKGDLTAALKKANEAVDSFPSAAGPHLARALILMTLERYEDALDDWLIVKTKMEPDELNAYRLYLNTAQCRWRLGDNAGAEADALEAKRLAPKTANPKELEAIEDLLDASEMAQVFGGPDSGPDHPMDIDSPEGKAILKKQSELTAEAATLRDKGDFPAALKKANEAVALFGLTANPLLVRATILMPLGRYKEALVDWDNVIDPMLDLGEVSNAGADDYILYYNRGLCRLKLGNKVGARADALNAKLQAPASIKPDDEMKDLAVMLGPPTPLGARWWRTKTENGHQVFSVWELHADGKCAVHSQPYRADGKYKINDTPSNQAWPGDERTLLGKVTVQGNRWQMTFAQPPIKAGGTYTISPDNKTLVGTEDGIEGSFTRHLVDVLDDDSESGSPPFTPNPSPSPVATQPEEKSSPSSVDAVLDYFASGQEVCALGRYFFYQQTPSEKEASLARQRVLLEKLHLGVSSEFEALARLSRENLPPGNYATWKKREQRRWDKNFVPAIAALTKACNRLAGQKPETDYFYLLGFETYALAVALPENAQKRGLQSAVTRTELGKGLDAFVWLRDHMPANRLTPEVASSVKGLANYKAGSAETLPQSEVDKVIELANAISDAAAAGKLLR